MGRGIAKIAIANRGEVAVRIIRACQELGIETVLLHSEADIKSMAYRLSDEQVCIGPAAVAESYLSIENTVNGAIAAGADAVHPGFGFLSENADFAEACEQNKIIFIGPSAQSIRLFGDKVSAKNLVEKIGGPLLPGYQGEDQSLVTLIAEAGKIGYPVMVKAAAGGGGRGLKVIRNRDEAKSLIESAQREGLSAFGSDRVFLEKYLENAKHIEVQIFGDCTGQVFSLLDRECSVQRRHQKVIEEAVSASLTTELRSQICESAVEIAREAKYTGAGTVEFLLQDGEFYFLEMNTRLQVEHPVTEMVMGVDLVKAQIMTADGQALLWEQEQLLPRGHAIECRLYAEDSFQAGMPSTGKLGACLWPMGAGRRFEVGFEEGDEVTPFYDSMIAKLVVWDESRPRAIAKMIQSLRETVVFGVKTNIPYLLACLDHPEFADSTMTTHFIEKHFPNGLSAERLQPPSEELLQQVLAEVRSMGGAASADKSSGPSPWFATWGGR